MYTGRRSVSCRLFGPASTLLCSVNVDFDSLNYFISSRSKNRGNDVILC